MTTVTPRTEASLDMAAPPDTAGSLQDPSQGAVRILFVDDDPILREFACVNLASGETTIETAADGEAALAAIRANLPDMVLLDLDMPVRDGIGVLSALRADPRTRQLPVIVVTGREDIEAVGRAFDAGATSFVVKPLNWRLLTHQVRYVHRTALSEQRLAEQRGATAERLFALAREGAQFIAEALAAEPSLRAAAVTFAKAADAALGPLEAPRAA
ncbi:MAG TPA: response regulator [Caulobacteraceae bacterium]|nr:response regulator [Caulobacteraceae bacterium]